MSEIGEDRKCPAHLRATRLTPLPTSEDMPAIPSPYQLQLKKALARRNRMR